MQEEVTLSSSTQSVTLKGIGEGDDEKVLEMVYTTAVELVPRIVENVSQTLNKSSFTIRCEAGYNKDDELVVRVAGTCTLAAKTKEVHGEILDGKLRLF